MLKEGERGLWWYLRPLQEFEEGGEGMLVMLGLCYSLARLQGGWLGVKWEVMVMLWRSSWRSYLVVHWEGYS